MKRVLLLFHFAVAGVICAFTAKNENYNSHKQYVGILYVNGRVYLQDDPSCPGNPWEIPIEWMDGDDYECLSSGGGAVCSVTIMDFIMPQFDFNVGCYYLDANDVLDFDDGEFFLL